MSERWTDYSRSQGEMGVVMRIFGYRSREELLKIVLDSESLAIQGLCVRPPAYRLS
jgi:predicted CopG family antitoxin